VSERLCHVPSCADVLSSSFKTLLLFTSDNFTPQLPPASYIWLVVVKKAPVKRMFASVAASASGLISPNVVQMATGASEVASHNIRTSGGWCQ
jgi:hypothetical protein